MRLTASQLKQMVPGITHVDHWIEAFDQLLPDYEINTPKRIAAFIAQCAHESGGFRFLKENLNYKAESLMKTFPKYFSDRDTANAYAKQPVKIANRVYASRMGNGDEASGDGYKYCGRGLIQLTGKSNYTWFSDSIEESLDETIKFLETYEGAVQSACWFWESNNLNKWADAGDIKQMTKVINGGYIGLEDRIHHIEHAIHVLSGK